MAALLIVILFIKYSTPLGVEIDDEDEYSAVAVANINRQHLKLTVCDIHLIN